MKKIFLTFFMTFSVFACHAQITQVNDMEEVFNTFSNADTETLAIFDVQSILSEVSRNPFRRYFYDYTTLS